MAGATLNPGVLYDAVIGSPLPARSNRLGLRMQDGKLCLIDFLGPDTPLRVPGDERAAQAVHQLEEYFSGARRQFDIPLHAPGTAFRQRVWRALQAIPHGETRTYGELARELNSSPRAVGGACRANPIPIVIPCHRVLARHGLGGYDGDVEGASMLVKQWLLAHERGA